MGSRLHSVSFRIFRDSASATVLFTPGMWEAVSQMLCAIQHSKTSISSLLIVFEWHVPIWFKHATAVVLSIRTETDFPDIVSEKDLNPRKTALVSR